MAGPVVTCDAARTAACLPFPELVAAIAQAAQERHAGAIVSPDRLVLPLGSGGVLLSMPATANDIGIHKLVTVQPANAGKGLPTIQGLVTVCDALTGAPLCILDGPELTGRRTAAVTLLAMQCLMARAPRKALLVGTGAQAVFHLHALHALHPGCAVRVAGRTPPRAAAFCDSHRAVHADLAPCAPGRIDDDVDLVVTLTTSTVPVYDEPGRPDRLVIGVGAFKPEMAEIGARTLATSRIYVDDPSGARHEAGDLIRAGIDWNGVRPLAAAVETAQALDRPIVFKSVGTGAWDLAAARVALKTLNAAS